MKREVLSVAIAVTLGSGIFPKAAMSGFYVIPQKCPGGECTDNCYTSEKCLEKCSGGCSDSCFTPEKCLEKCSSPNGIPVPKTGQTGCSYYSGGTWQWDESCTNATRPPGQDGDLKPGAAWPNPRFTINSDGTVTDNLTGLIWLKNANCDGRKSWSDALTFAANLQSGVCGLTDSSSAGQWRVPTIHELVSLANYDYFKPALSNTVGTGKWTAGAPFDNVPAGGVGPLGENVHYWTSTTHAAPVESGSVFYSEAWFVEMRTGNPCKDVKGTTNYLWPVRGPAQ